MTRSADDYFDQANLFEIQDRLGDAIESYNRAIELQPMFPEAYFNRAGNWELLGNYGNAIADYETAIAQSPEEPTSYESLARIHLDADDPTFRDPELALANARRACELTGFASFKILSILAEACNASGRHRVAVRYQSKAIGLASKLIATNCDAVRRSSPSKWLRDRLRSLFRGR